MALIHKALSRRGLGVLFILTSLVIYTSAKNYNEVLLEGGSGYSLTEALILIFAYYFFKSIQKDNLKSKLYSLVPLFGYYVLYEWNFIQFGSVLKFSDFLILPELLDVLLVYEAVLIVIVLLLPFVLIISNIRTKWRTQYSIYPVIFASSLFLFSSVSVSVGEQVYKTLPLQEFSHEHMVALYGPISTAFIFEFERRYRLEKILNYSESDDSKNGMSMNRVLPEKGVSIVGRNLHLIILESFVDVRKFKKIDLTHKILEKFEYSMFKNSSISLAPGFGNGTARSEFEILCGIPSMQLFGSIEFNIFDGENRVDCLPNILSGLGYHSVASHPFKPNYYNRIKAYSTLGFAEMKFGDKYSKALGGVVIDDAPDGWLFDKSLYDQNLAMLREQLKNGKPIFNYVLTAFGHYPFERNVELRPDVISLKSVGTETNRLLNQTYYRVEALHQYIKSLQELDPDGLIVVVGDHLPPLAGGKIKYDALGYVSGKVAESRLNKYNKSGGLSKYHETLVFAMDGDGYLELPDINHFNIFMIVLNKLFDGEYCKLNRCHYLEDIKSEGYSNEYTSLMIQSINPN